MVSTMVVHGVNFSPVFLLLGAGVLLLSLAFFLWPKSTPNSVPAESKKYPLEDEPDDDGMSKKVTVLFGTQTGTAEGYAQAFAEEGRTRYNGEVTFKTVALDKYGDEADIFEAKLKEEQLVIFYLATYGDGEPTDDAADFYKWLTELSDDKGAWLSNLQYAVFGCGNSTYEHFCKVGKVVDERLSIFGAQRLVEVGLGDDDHVQEDDFNAWKEGLWSHLDKLLDSKIDVPPTPGSAYSIAIPEYKVEIHEQGTEMVQRDFSKSFKSFKRNRVIYDAHNPCKCFVAARRELHTELSDRSCTHVEFDISNTGLTYETGDHLAVYAENHKEYVEEAAQLLGQPLDLMFTLHIDDKVENPKNASLHAPFPGPVTLEAALRRYADLLSPPKKSVLTVLAAYASVKEEEARLRMLTSPFGKEEYNDYVVKSKRTLLEVMSDFPSVRVPLGVFFAVVSPRLQPRFYSISSSPKFSPDRIHISCALVLGTSASEKVFRGVSSTWLKGSIPAEEDQENASLAPIYVRTSTFRLPVDPKKPIVMVGPGTGLAPFRGFLQERAALKDSGVTLGPAILFFGCRSRKQDFIYEEELNDFVKRGVLSDLSVAFSREGTTKEYVQNKMMQQASAVWDHLSNGGYFYVCGDAKGMAKDVHRTLLTIIQEQDYVDGSKAEAIVKQMQNEGRYQRDVW
ncbi:hypothetical protein R1flu_020584 [Riccia fluitans]|uniref:NADPH--cytochrome P450 reductase n=1 Tax=Riccia fluitans TaxID=41844 RepID=A0ABD1ZLY2_9MARC